MSSDQWAQIVPGAAVLLSWSFKAGADVLPQTPDAHECALWRTCPAPSTPSGVDCRFAVEFSAPMFSPQSQAEPIGMGGRQCISNEFARVSVRCAGYMPCNMPKTMDPSPLRSKRSHFVSPGMCLRLCARTSSREAFMTA